MEENGKATCKYARDHKALRVQRGPDQYLEHFVKNVAIDGLVYSSTWKAAKAADLGKADRGHGSLSKLGCREKYTTRAGPPMTVANCVEVAALIAT